MLAKFLFVNIRRICTADFIRLYTGHFVLRLILHQLRYDLIKVHWFFAETPVPYRFQVVFIGFRDGRMDSAIIPSET